MKVRSQRTWIMIDRDQDTFSLLLQKCYPSSTPPQISGIMIELHVIDCWTYFAAIASWTAVNREVPDQAFSVDFLSFELKDCSLISLLCASSNQKIDETSSPPSVGYQGQSSINLVSQEHATVLDEDIICPRLPTSNLQPPTSILQPTYTIPYHTSYICSRDIDDNKV